MNRSRQTIARVLLVATAVAVVPAMNPSSVGASPVEDQREEVQRITDELERLEQESDILAEDYVTAIDEKNQLDAQVAEAEEDVAAKETEVEELRGELSEVAVRAFTSSGSDALGPMFSDSSQYTENLQRDQLSRVALSTGTATTDELDQAVAELEAERSNLEDMRAAAEEQTRHVEEAKRANEERKADYESARAEAEETLGRLIQEEEERRARESYERMQREAEEAAAAAAAEQAAAAAAVQQQAAEQEQTSSTTTDSSSSSNGGTSDGGGGGGESVLAADRAPRAPAPDPEEEQEEEQRRSRSRSPSARRSPPATRRPRRGPGPPSTRR